MRAAALSPYEHGDFEEAVTRLTDLVGSRPTSTAAHFYLGVTNLYRDQDFAALLSLEFAERGIRSKAAGLVQRASFYLATAYVRIGELDRGRNLLEALCRDRGQSARRACDGLREMSAPIRLSGIVTGPGGEPLSGVKVGQHLLRSEDIYLVTSPTRFSAMTDSAGRFAVLQPPVSLWRKAIVAAKPGYFTRSALVAFPPESEPAFRLVPWSTTARRTAAGASCHGRLDLPDPRSEFHDRAASLRADDASQVRQAAGPVTAG